jgi:tetratricopeptide (TPR) repeat protein
MSVKSSLAAIQSSLEKADPEQTTNLQFKELLDETLKRVQEPGGRRADLYYFATGESLFLGNADLAELYQSLKRIEQSPLREAAAFFEAAIQRRADTGDLWPDGRLQLGIALAELGEFERASNVLEQVIEICERGDLFSQNKFDLAA